MSWRWDDHSDTENEINPGTIIGITAGAIVVLGVVVVVVANRSPPLSCFRVLDRNLMYLPFVWFFVMAASILITATSSEVGSKLPIAVGGSCFLAWAALIAFVIWRVKVNYQATRSEDALEGDDSSMTVYAIPIDSESK